MSYNFLSMASIFTDISLVTKYKKFKMENTLDHKRHGEIHEIISPGKF